MVDGNNNRNDDKETTMTTTQTTTATTTPPAEIRAARARAEAAADRDLAEHPDCTADYARGARARAYADEGIGDPSDVSECETCGSSEGVTSSKAAAMPDGCPDCHAR